MKYLSEIFLNNLFSLQNFNKISSDFILVSPYGELASPKGIDSFTGKIFGIPYTVHEEEKMNLFTLNFLQHLNKIFIPSTLLKKYFLGF